MDIFLVAWMVKRNFWSTNNSKKKRNSSNGWKDKKKKQKKKWHTHTLEYYSAVEQKEIPPFVTTWMDEKAEDIILSKICHRKKQVLYDLTYKWNRKLKLLEVEGTMVVARGWDVGEMGRC